MSLEKLRLKYLIKVPTRLKNISKIFIKEEGLKKEIDPQLKKIFSKTYDQKILSFKEGNEKKFPLNVGVVFSGGPAPGGHNIVAGLFDSLMELDEKSKLFGFLDGPKGIIENRYIEISKKLIDSVRNTGGFDLLGSSRTKIEKKDQLENSIKTCKNLNLDALIIIGGDDSNTNGAILAEYFLENNLLTRVVGVPKTIDGDLKNEYIPISFGFDTATKVYSEMVGNLAKDALSSKKYYHFIKLMGRSASHIALECAFKTKPNYTLIAEEVFEKKKTLDQITKEIADIVIERAKKNKDYGVILIPEGLIEFIPEIKVLIKEVNFLLAKDEKIEKFSKFSEKIEYIEKVLSKEARKTLNSIPENIQKQLFLERDPHGNVQVSRIETEKLIIEKVKKELSSREDYKSKFSPLPHFFGYEGRSSFPSNFDSTYCYLLGFVAICLVKEKKTGYIACLKNLHLDKEEWIPMGIPLVSLMNMEERKGEKKPVIKKALVDLKSKAFLSFKKERENWKIDDRYEVFGPIQFFEKKEITDDCPTIIKF